MLLLPVEVALQFDVRAAAEDATDLVHRGLVRAREAVETGGVLLDEVPGVPGLAFGMFERPRREELAEIFVARAVLDEEADRALVIDPQLRPDDRPHPILLRRRVKARRAVQAVRIHDGHRWQI